uniref:THAP-type domain-containing protein n=1 Tax=Culex tarsalis TaxID=7177 RepID=A0A1Q3F0F1_CULTA
MADQRNVPANVKQCSACGHNSTSYKGSFIRVPREEDKRRMWLVRLGIVEDDEPMPMTRSFFVCQDHFDMKRDFKPVGGGIRLRSGTLPWRNLANGERSYHGLDEQPTIAKSSPDCVCRCCLKRKIRSDMGPERRPTASQTNDFDLWSAPQIRKLPVGAFLCWFCRGTNGLKALFSGGSPLFPLLLDQIYTVTGILLNSTQSEDALICKGCQQQVEQSWGFRLRTRACFGPDGTFIRSKKETSKAVEVTPKPVAKVPTTVTLPKAVPKVITQVRSVPKPTKIVQQVVRSVPKPARQIQKPPPLLEPEHFLFEVEPLDEPEVKRIKTEPPGEEYEPLQVKAESIAVKIEK